jgi:hypothetical protein
MRAGPADSSLAGAVTWTPVASSSLADAILADSIPIIGGRLTVDITLQVPERLTFTVPEWADGFSWVPDSPTHPLAKFGQVVDLQLNVGEPVSLVDWQIRIGRYQIQNWHHDDDAGTVEVECLGLLQVCLDDSFTVPPAPRSTDTFVSAFTRLVSDGVGVSFDVTLTDRALPQSFQWDQDRLGALYDIADAWPARVRVDQYGVIQVLAPLPAVPAPVLTLTDGERGTVIGAPRGDTRDGVSNVIVARSSATDDPARAPVQGIASVTSGPLDPDTYGSVVEFYSSPLITTKAQCLAAAATRLANAIRPTVARVVTLAPDPRIDVDDAVTLVQGTRGFLDGFADNGWITGYTLPLTVDDGAMQLTVGVAQ